ncbi:MAG: sigma 54-interacting transcriptional regulator [Thermodesulfovibrionales bacterium]|nr:sigma 54-interacting transcriptional regulator [Thermodesulfovibrionales bacterium]
MGNLSNPYGCCYKPQISIDELKKLFEIFIADHEHLRQLQSLNEIGSLLVSILKKRYPRVRLYVADPSEETYYGFISAGMDAEFKKRFDSYPADPFEKKLYKIKFNEVPLETSEKVHGTENTYILCSKKINDIYQKTEKPDYIKDLGFEDIINHSLTVHIMALNTLLGAISVDFNMLEEKFSFEECQILDAFVGTYYGRIIAPSLISEYKKVDEKSEEINGNHISIESSFYERFKMGIKFNTMIYNEAEKHHILKKTFEDINLYQEINEPFLILGDSGTGKRHVAEAFKITNKPFVKFSCNTLGGDRNIQTDKLFGRPKGHPNGSDQEHIGCFMKACDISYVGTRLEMGNNPGILFLDELDKMPHDSQQLFMQAIDEKKAKDFLGHEYDITARIIAATNKSPDSEIFISDFVPRFRFQISLPPLKDRPYDIPLLINWIITKFKRAYPYLVADKIYITKEALEFLIGYDYKSENIRELESIIGSLVFKYSKITKEILPPKTLVSKATLSGCPELVQIYPWPDATFNTTQEENTDSVSPHLEDTETSPNNKFADYESIFTIQIQNEFFDFISQLTKEDRIKVDKVIKGKRGKVKGFWRNIKGQKLKYAQFSARYNEVMRQ